MFLCFVSPSTWKLRALETYVPGHSTQSSLEVDGVREESEGSSDATPHILTSPMSSLLLFFLFLFLTPPPSLHRKQTIPSPCTVCPSHVALSPVPTLLPTPQMNLLWVGLSSISPIRMGLLWRGIHPPAAGRTKMSSSPYIYGRQNNHKTMKRHEELFSLFLHRRKSTQKKLRRGQVTECLQASL